MDYERTVMLNELKAYIGNSKTIAFDFKTAPIADYQHIAKASLNANTANIVGVGFSVKVGTGVYISLNHADKNANFDEIISYLARLMADSYIVKIAHNLAFKSMFLYKHGITMQQPLYDTVVAHQMALKTEHTFNTLNDSELTTLAGEYFGELIPTNIKTVECACANADYTLRLYHRLNKWFRQNLPKHRYIAEKIESPVAGYTGIMRFNGILVDKDLMVTKQREADIKIAQLKNALINIVGSDIHIGASASTEALKYYIFNTLGLPMLKPKEKGRATLDDESLMLLAEWCGKNRPELEELFILIKQYRQWGNLKSTFIDGYIKRINIATGRIYPNLMQLGAKSGRFSCSEPNLQNISNNLPVNIRDFIVAPAGHSIIECDYNQIEARLAAYLSQDKVLLDIYAKDLDLHAMTTAAIYKITTQEASDKSNLLYKKRRTVAKATFFGFLYGISDSGLSRNLKTAGINSSISECNQFLRNLANSYKILSEWQKSTVKIAKNRLYSETALGRRCYCPDINSPTHKLRGNAERSALNHSVQGLAADLLKQSMSRLMSVISDNPHIKPIFTIHDSLIFYVPDERLDSSIDLIKDAMEKPLPIDSFNIPIVVDVSAGKTYGTMYDYI